MKDVTFKFRFVNEIAGVFVLLTIAVLIAGIFLAGRAQGLFEPKFRLHTVFQAEKGTYGLKKGSEVRICDTAAGSVARIHPTAEGTIEATFELKESYHGFVRANSVAVVKKTLLVVGDSYVDISIGSRHEPQMPDGSRILCTADRGIAAQASQVLEELHTRGLPTLERLNAVLDKMPALMSQFRDTLRDAEVLFEGLQRHWMVRGYIKDTKPARPDPPAPGNPSPVGTK